MPTGLTPMRGTIAPALPGQGASEWQTLSGASPDNPLVGGPYVPGLGAQDPDRGRSRLVSIPGAGDPANATTGSPHAAVFDDWRDLFNWKGSPMPWLLLFTLAMLGFANLAVKARVGPVRAAAGIG